MLAILLFLATAAGAPADGCHAFIPETLQRQLEVQHPEHRIPLADDATCQMEHQPPCLLATSGDFNGDGKPDYAVILPSRSGQAPPLFLAAFATDSEWRVQQFPL